MRKEGVVIMRKLGAKNKNHIFVAGDKVTENDLENFDECVKMGKVRLIEPKEESKEGPKKESKKNK